MNLDHNGFSHSRMDQIDADGAARAEFIDARLRRLERESRRWRIAFAAAAALLAAVVTTGASLRASVPDVLAAQSFSLVDGDGRIRGQWRLGEAGAELVALASDGSVSGVLAVAGGAVSVPVAMPQSAEGRGSRIKLGPPEDAEEDTDSFDWVD